MSSAFVCICALVVLLSAPPAQSENGCYCLDGSYPPRMTWTGFKYSSKVGVVGTFRELLVDYDNDAATVRELLGSGSFTAKIDSVNSGNLMRDTRLRESFFRFFASNNINGQVKSVTDETFKVDVQINMRTLPLVFEYKIGKDLVFVARAAFDLMRVGLGRAYRELHEACIEEHTGEDGIPKTWTDVELAVVAKLKKGCSCGF